MNILIPTEPPSIFKTFLRILTPLKLFWPRVIVVKVNFREATERIVFHKKVAPLNLGVGSEPALKRAAPGIVVANLACPQPISFSAGCIIHRRKLIHAADKSIEHDLIFPVALAETAINSRRDVEGLPHSAIHVPVVVEKPGLKD